MRHTRTAITLTALGYLMMVSLFISRGSIAQMLSGPVGQSAQSNSGWIDLAPPVDFEKGDRLRLLIGRSANRILVRLLPDGSFPESSVGILGGPIDVPKTRVVEVILPNERKRTIQISVHGGPNPWGKFWLGGGNGPATLESAERIGPRHTPNR